MNKIHDAIKKAFEATETEYNDSVLQFIAINVTADFSKKVKNGKISVEDIQDSVESVLSKSGYDNVAKAYILYRKEREKLRNIKTTLLDYKETVNKYLHVEDWRVKENSTVTYSIGGLILSNSGAVTANYWLNEIYDKEIAEAHKNCDLHIHDLSMLTGYCFTGDTRIKLINGTVRSFKELVDSKVKDFWVYSKDENGYTVPGHAYNPRITRKNAELVRVVLDNHEEIRCTPDHPFMLRDGTYKKAEDLESGESLCAGYFLTTRNGYLGVSARKYESNSYKAFHRIVAENVILHRPLLKNEKVHHIDGNKFNNEPNNLFVMYDRDHRSMEIRKTMLTDKWKENNRSSLSKRNKTEYMRELSRNRQIERNKSDRQRALASYGSVKNSFKSSELKENYINYVEQNGFVGYGEYINMTCPINHKVLFVEKLPYKEDVYDITVCGFHNFLLDSGVFVHNCAGWSLKQLIQQGLGIPGKTTSTPASHLSTLCNQMVNFIGCLQNEWAGAQAFSSFDTYLAPFVKKDNLTYKEVKQCIQSLVFGLNTPSRWGCVDSETELLTVNGWKKFNEVSKGEQIYTWKDGVLELNSINEVVVKNYTGKMHVYKGIGYEQMVSPDHRILFKHHNEEVYEIRHSSDIFNVKTPYPLPIMFEQSEIKDSVLSDDEVKLAAAIYTDGSIDIRNGSVHKIQIYKSPKRFGNELIIEASKNLGLEFSHYKKPSTFGEINIYAYYGENARRLYELVGSKKEISKKFLSLNKYQATIFLETWALFDGSVEKAKLQVDNSVIASQIQHIAILAGFCSYMSSTKKTNYIRLHRERHVIPSERYEVDYDGIIWCPNVENGTAVFRKNGNTFISGQCQSPFSNITLDWTVPKDIAPLPAIVGGKEMNFTYGECQKEMDMVNKAFIEIMIEGDANGRGFQYPIPTYSITRDFDWSETENNKLLFEMTSKYGTPYFSNYINSDMEPSDVRSMCVMPDTKVNVIIKKTGKCLYIPIAELFDKYKMSDYEILTSVGYMPVRKQFKLEYNGEMVEATTESNKTLVTTLDHPWRILPPKGEMVSVMADLIQVGDYVYSLKKSDNRIRQGFIEKIAKIERKEYHGFVYDVEIDTDGDYVTEHTFYANDILTGNCCRLRLDLRELRKKSGGFFGSGESTGSVGVVTINMPRIAYLSKNVEEFYERLDKLMDIAARSLDVKRKVVTKYLEDGLYPYTKHYLGTFANHFSTIGLVGMNEVGLNAKWLRCDMTDERCQKFSMEVLDHMRERLSDYQEMYGDLYNLEATPAESTSYRLAKHDVETFNDIITAAEPGGTPYYTNSSHLPVGYTEDVFAALDVQDELQTRYTSGTVFHAFLGEKLPTWKTAMNLVRKIAENYKLPYYTLSPTYSVCKQHGYINGEQFKCPTCGDSTEVYSRITGYYRPVQNWNDGKAQEYKERKEYVLEHSHLTHEGCKCEEHKEESKAEVNEPILFASKTCPNCRIACTYLEKANFKYKKLFADENVEYATQLGVKQAPTLLIPDDNGGFMKYSGAGAIKEYLDKHKS